MMLRPGSRFYEPIDWNEAFTRVGGALKGLDSPDEAIFYTSGRTSNEAAFLYQLFVRAFGTNNLPDCSNMCHESSGVGLGETVGIGKGSVTRHWEGLRHPRGRPRSRHHHRDGSKPGDEPSTHADRVAKGEEERRPDHRD